METKDDLIEKFQNHIKMGCIRLMLEYGTEAEKMVALKELREIWGKPGAMTLLISKVK